MVRNRVKIQSVVESQLPEFVKEEYPLLTNFLQQYYKSQEYVGSAYDILQWIDEYLKVDNLTEPNEELKLVSNISSVDTEISVFTLTPVGTIDTFPRTNGLIKIGNEIILYERLEQSTFFGCSRGFSGVTSYKNPAKQDELVFSTSSAESHSSGSIVTCLNKLFLEEFLSKIKRQISPGFEDRTLSDNLNQNIFLKQSKDFYSSKGTDDSFKILFGALFGENVEVIKPRENLFIPSSAGYRVTNDLVVEVISGNLLDVLNQTLYQDEYSNYGVKKSYASVTNVEKIFIDDREFYKLSYDADFDKDIILREGSQYGDFVVHPKTKIISNVSVNQNIIFVDSTIGFPESGELRVTDIDGNQIVLNYSGKTVNEFLNVTGVTSVLGSGKDLYLNIYAYAYSNKNNDEIVTLRITSVLKNFSYTGKEYLYSKGDTVKIKTLGSYSNSNKRASDWIFNVASHFKTKSISLDNTSSGYQYIVETYKTPNVLKNDLLNIIVGNKVVGECKVSQVNSENIFAITKFSGITLPLNLNLEYIFERKLLKGLSSNNQNINNRVANIQNVYVNKDKDVYVASPSIPNYGVELNTYNKKYSINGTFTGTDTLDFSPVNAEPTWDHGFYTGDAVYYKSGSTTSSFYDQNTGNTITTTIESIFDGLSEGIYYVTRVDQRRVKLSRNRNDLYVKQYITFSGTVTNNEIGYYEFISADLYPQNLVREIKSTVVDDGFSYPTKPGTTGILLNGVEILNYKSTDFISYGNIENIEVLSEGENYDVINPPVLEISDDSGSNASGVCAVNGSLKEIQIVDTGFDYINEPVIDITGGNGFGARAFASTTKVTHSVSFDNDPASGLLSLYSIGFTTFHKFRDNESVIYKTDDQSGITGLTTDAQYYLSIVNGYTVRLHKTLEDSISGINTVQILSRGIGVHRLESTTQKKIISDIKIVDGGEGYENKKRYVQDVGIKTAYDSIEIENHGYETGEIIRYYTNGSPIGGLVNEKDYIVKKIDKDSFKLYNVGVGLTSVDFYLKRDEYLNITSLGSGTHYFNYQPISVSIIGNIGVSQLANQDFTAKINPIFHGSINSIQVTNSGVGYGSSEIINYDRQPIFNLNSGSGAEVTAVVSNGSIVDIIVNRGGSGYNSIPQLIVSGTGKNYKLVPIIKNGSLDSVKIINGGSGFGQTALITVLPYGNGAKIRANIKKWNINLFSKNLNIVKEDDGILRRIDDTSTGIQYCHLYAPRKLRETIFASDIGFVSSGNTKKYGVNDLFISEKTKQETTTKYHSPIIGWAYDGNPIYGPNGYSNATGEGGVIKALKSGYILSPKSQSDGRPLKSIFPDGFFIEDYVFTNIGDLDEHNGRYCVTPEFPNGVYAYFATIDSGLPQESGPFVNYKLPQFPYFIGDTYKSKPNEFNFLLTSNQNYIDNNSQNLFRITDNYNLDNNYGGYNYIYNPNDYREQTSDVIAESFGKIDSIEIVSGGDNYKIGDEIVFDNSDIDGSGAVAKVSGIKGKTVNSISVDYYDLSDLELYSYYNKLILFADSPHNFRNNDIISVSGISTEYSNLYKSYNVGVTSETYILSVGVGSTSTTGIVTYFYVNGNLNFPLIRENDIFSIEDEKVKVLNIERDSKRIRVLREYDGTVGISHTASTLLQEIPRKISIQVPSKVNTIFDYNNQTYFNPKESVGLGTTAIDNLVTFSLPGIGITQISVKSNSIYIPDHNFNTGQKLTYNSNSGIGISVFDQSVEYTLPDDQDVYAFVISKDFIGISTNKVGLGTTGISVGVGSTATLLSFTSFGSGEYHSFKTNKEIKTANVVRNEVTVSTASTHGLFVNDTVEIDVLPKLEKEIIVSYNDFNRRIVFNPVGFASTSIDEINNIITINSHNFKTGDKVIYTTDNVTSFLDNNGMYFVYVFDKNNIQLCQSKFECLSNTPTFVGLGTTVSGLLSAINPPIEVTRNNTLKFNLSDDSLSFFRVQNYPAFELNLYYDSNFSNKFYSTSKTRFFELQRSSGRVGIDTNAYVTLSVNENLPDKLYYKFDLKNTDIIGNIKSEILIDQEVDDSNSITFVDSKYSRKTVLTGVGTNTFKYQLSVEPEEDSYNLNQANITYKTNSTNAYGAIDSIKIFEGGKYKELPKITSVVSVAGTNAILNSQSETIGNIQKIKINDIGFDYPTDNTLKPIANLPEIVFITPLTSFESITVSYSGKNYISPPDLVVLDGFTNKKVDDVILKFTLGKTSVDIIQNSYGFYNVAPRIIPINNSNGVGINSISFNPTTKDVTVGFATGFSDEFPFAVGDKVLIENTNVGFTTIINGQNSFVVDGKGYNSSLYGYKLFTITQVNESLGGNVGSITYNISDDLEDGETPGTFNASRSIGRAIPEKYFPFFIPKLRKNDYIIGETVESNSGQVGIVEYWNNNIDLLKISTNKEFSLGSIVSGLTSKTKGIVGKKIDFDTNYETGAYSKVEKGWTYDTGILNENTQRIHDNDYYQYFSYAIKSRISYDRWEEPVSSLNHTSGFKKFSDLVVESSDSTSRKIGVDNDLETIVDIIGEVDINCVYNFDLVSENSVTVEGRVISDQIRFSSRILTDYFESVGNRVLVIDDISSQFNSEPRPDNYAVVSSFDANYKANKYFVYIKDSRFNMVRQSDIVILLHNGTDAYINQYGKVFSYRDLGNYDFRIFGTEGQLLFYPITYKINDYDIAYISFGLSDSVTSIGSTSLGDIVRLHTSNATIPNGSLSGVGRNVVSIASTYRSVKVLLQMSEDNGDYEELNEFNIIHDGTNVYSTEFGQITSENPTPLFGTGIGTYNAYLSGGLIKLDFVPYNNLTSNYTVNCFNVSIADTSSSGVGTSQIATVSNIKSTRTSIASSTSPVSNIISFYNNAFDSAYYVICLEDTTNNQYEICEVVVVDDNKDSYITKYGAVYTDSPFGTIGVTTSSTATNLLFTPDPNIDVEVTVFQSALRLSGVTTTSNIYDLNNGRVFSNASRYYGTENSLIREFNLTHRQRDIFIRNFDGNDSNIVDIAEDSIKIPDHFFITGEKVQYQRLENSNAISIASTNVPGIGITDKLPNDVYVVKVNESKIKLAATAENALKEVPIVFDLTGVGVGTAHTIAALDQNAKTLIAIDNMIQSPIVKSDIRTGLSTDIDEFDTRLYFSGITSFFGGELVEIDNEIVRIRSVGFGSTNAVLVYRGWMGTQITEHNFGATVTKVTGNYNIVGNKINFVDAPYGNTPFSSITNPPDSVDWVGISTGSSFQGRVFLRGGFVGSSTDTYSNNYVFDDISQRFNGLETDFDLTSNGNNVSGFSTDNAIVLVNGIFQIPQGIQGETQNYSLTENTGITSISFTGTATSVAYDINNASIPVGGVIVSVGSTFGFGYQPLVSAGGTAIVSAAGTIQSISIGNSGSGYRVGIQTIVNVGVQTYSTGTPSIEFIGTAAISNGNIISISITNPGSGYTSTNPPKVVIDDPLPYSDIPLIYSTSSASGVGTQATVNVTVGQGSSVIDFELKNLGYGYGQGQILTIPVGGTSGIPTDPTKPFSEFNITIDRVDNDSFSAWSIGQLELLDSFEDRFDGITRSFNLRYNSTPISIIASKGSLVDVKSTLLVFLNDILQDPSYAYQFNGGSSITFVEAPDPDDSCKVLFYKGTGDIDVIFRDVEETIKEGDTVTINSSRLLGQNTSLQQDPRVVTGINTADSIQTNPYGGLGISTDSTLLRPLTWCKQTSDTIIENRFVTKDRIKYEPLVYPHSTIINNVSSGSTIIYVDNVRPNYNASNENNGTRINVIDIISQDSKVSCSATAVVSSAGTITSIVITESGEGYISAPNIIIQSPLGTGVTATATASVSSGSVVSISVSNIGSGYTTTNPPLVSIAPPTIVKETKNVASYYGDDGIIVGFGITLVGSTNNAVFDFLVPFDYPVRDSSIVSGPSILSGISTGDYFVVSNSNIGVALTSVRNDSSVIGYAGTYLDNIFQVSDFEIVSRTVGTGTTLVKRIYAPIKSYTQFAFDSTLYSFDSTIETFDTFATGISTYPTGITTGNYLGDFRWGKIYTSTPVINNYDSYVNYGIVGVETSAYVRRTNPLKYSDYTI